MDGSGNAYVTGYCVGVDSSWDYATIKYNSSGVQQWVQRYSGPGHSFDRAYSIAVDGSGNVYVTGVSSNSGGTTYDYATIKYTASGDSAWVRRYNGPGNGDDEATSIAVDSLGNVYVTGRSTGNGTSLDYATIRYNSAGVQEWVQRYNGPGKAADVANSIKVDGSGKVYVTGWSWGIGTHADYATVKYSQTIGIQPISSEVPSQFQLYQNYPNPFNATTKIRFDVPSNLTLSGAKGLNVKLLIYDILGREVTTLVNEELKPGTYEIEWDAANHPSGMYFYKLVAGEFTQTNKMTSIKYRRD